MPPIGAAPAILALLAVPAAAETPDLGVAVTYICAGGAVLQVAYLNPPAIPALAVVAWGGRLVPMQAGPTGSGVRYLSLSGQPPLVWHSKGPQGTLFSLGPSQQQAVLLGDCTEAGS